MAAETHTDAAAILDAALAHVPFDGWSTAALRRGAADRGLPADAADRAFPRGPAEAIELWNAVCNARMAAALADLDLAALKIRRRIATAVRLRIEAYGAGGGGGGVGGRQTVRRTLSWLAAPGHAALAATLLYRTVDEIWYRCGDTATDFNFYTKRALLAGVYSSTLLCWLDDTSEGHAETWAFLDRRIDNVMQVPKLTARLRRGPLPKTRPFDPARFARRVATRLREGA
jgi:ubiquinone biosynthesis protein COQ9